ncbi:MAG: hypothetical protein KJ645_12205 [Planctomycetes bacterium]|nr:hypothetical protein [Planctomycetota bacterium]
MTYRFFAYWIGIGFFALGLILIYFLGESYGSRPLKPYRVTGAVPTPMARKLFEDWMITDKQKAGLKTRLHSIGERRIYSPSSGHAACFAGLKAHANVDFVGCCFDDSIQLKE